MTSRETKRGATGPAILGVQRKCKLRYASVGGMAYKAEQLMVNDRDAVQALMRSVRDVEYQKEGGSTATCFARVVAGETISAGAGPEVSSRGAR